VVGRNAVGPLLSKASADGSSLRLENGRAVAIRGGFRDRSGRWVRRGVTFTFTPVACGVRLSFGAEAGDLIAYVGFFTRSPSRSGTSVRDSSQAIRFPAAPDLALSGAFASGTDVGLVRARGRFRRSRAGTAAIQICGR
jgi:hypothetical protein